MSRRNKLMFLGWTTPKREGYVDREFGRGGEVHVAMQHEGDKLKAFLKVKKLVPRYQRS
jgi:hypothetical protein